MTLGPARWQVISESNFQWEREALDWLRSNLPDRDPWAVWTNFEFIDDEGKVNEVDALVQSPAGLFLVEIKSRPGTLTGDTHSWTWRTDGRDRTYDNPLILANRKAKRLASLLKRQPAVMKAKIKVPYLEPAIFLSSTSLDCRLEGLAKSGTYQHGRPGLLNDDGIVAALVNGITQRNPVPVDTQQARAIAKGLIELGIRPSNKHRQVGDYQLDKLLAEGDGFQDWSAHHVSVDSVHRRVRIHNIASATSPEARAARIRAAKREFEMLEGIDHPGLLKVKDYKDTELGPALIFDHDPRAIRLDHLLRDHGARLGVTQRLQLIRDIAETLKFAHGKRLYHRALGPQSVLVLDAETNRPRPQLMNWQTGSRNAGLGGEDGAAAGTLHHTTGTRHVEDYVDDPGLVYLAPETTRADPSSGAALDVFSLGCIAYHVFSGQPPASSVLELIDKLRRGQGLRLSDVLDGCGSKLQDLIQFATSPVPMTRWETIDQFIAELEAVEDELTTPDPETTVDPSSAVANDRLEGGFTVVRRMGKGSSSDALLVKEDGSDDELVLKVAIDVAHNERLQIEGEILANLRHPNIVEHRRTLSVAGRTALLLRNAGDQNLAEQIRKDGRLSLDLLQRFGEELIEVVHQLEGEGVAHRDIKPENIGISRSRGGKLQLVLFDFSLSRTPPENITAGTSPYLDPFLPLRGPRPRWDLFAERFAAAITLYEMAVGQTPKWGDGRTAPAMLDVEATLDIDVFDPVIREPLGKFFAKALQRDYRQRHDNAEEMLRHWRAVFTARSSTVHPPQPEGFEAIAQIATAQTTMAELGYSLEAQEVLDRMGIHNARELLAVDRIRFRLLRGVADKTRKEIRLKAKDLARLRPNLTDGRSTLHDGGYDIEGAVSINEIAGQLLPRRAASDDRPDEDALEIYLGLDDSAPAGRWMTLGEVAQQVQIDRTALADTLAKARQRWLKQPTFTELRDQVDTLVRSHAQVMSVHEAAMALLALRGCASQDDVDRLRLATAVLRAACEAEVHLEKPRFEAHDHQPTLLIATSAVWADYARQLGAAADACAMADPLLPPQRVLETLESVPLPAPLADGLPHSPLPTTRLLRLAVSASRKAALSSRLEIYPRGMPAVLALRQSIGALVGAPQLRVAELRDRVRGRYPEAAALPKRPELDHLLEEAGAPLVWDATAFNGEGAYRSAVLSNALTVGATTQFSRHGTAMGIGVSGDAAITNAQLVEQRLQRALGKGGLLVITVEPRLARHGEAALLRRYSAPAAKPGSPVQLTRLSFDALLLRELKAQALAARVDWNLVLHADAAEPGSRDWTNLMRLIQRSVPALRTALLHSPTPLLLVNLGLLARYNLMNLVTELEDQAGRPDHTPAAWLLLPTHREGPPLIDGVALPLVQNIHQTQALALPQAWIENRHRAGQPA